MIFNSVDFAIFFTVFFALYWLIGRIGLKWQNLFLLAGSYFFYCWWDWRFLSLIIGSSLLNYFIGLYIADESKSEKSRNILYYLGLAQGIGGLLYFKYFNFFITSFVSAFSLFNIHLNIHTLNLILPLGISFYTFRNISYILDIDSGKVEPSKDWVVYFSYIAFFPTLLSGPIDRAKPFIPQLENKRNFNYLQAVDGLRQILWGLFKKIVIADNCASSADIIINRYEIWSNSSTLIAGAFFFTIQLYADFSGYSDMAIGISKLLGFNVTKNFNFPYFSQSIVEYWRKWHMSLTSWVTEYVFTPLSFTLRQYGKLGLIIAILANFTIVGIWHGANWNFILFGIIHGMYFIPSILRGTMNTNKSITTYKLIPTFREFINILITFLIVVLTNVVFRTDNLHIAFDYYKRIIYNNPFSFPELVNPKVAVISTFIFLILEWIGRENEYAIQKTGLNWNKILRYAFYYCILLSILFFSGNEQEFIYFKF